MRQADCRLRRPPAKARVVLILLMQTVNIFPYGSTLRVSYTSGHRDVCTGMHQPTNGMAYASMVVEWVALTMGKLRGDRIRNDEDKSTPPLVASWLASGCSRCASVSNCTVTATRIRAHHERAASVSEHAGAIFCVQRDALVD